MSHWRSEAVTQLSQTTGYAEAALDRSLMNLFEYMSEAWLMRWLDFSALVGRELTGPRLVGVVAAGNLPGTAIPSMVQALLLRSTCLVKSSSAEPHLMPLYASSVAYESPELAQAMAVMSWPREDRASTEAFLNASDALIAYGSDTTLDALRRDSPQDRPFIGYGHRLSFSVIGRPALTKERSGLTARLAARDIALFDQQGCLSPQALYVQRGGEVPPAQFGELLAEELERVQSEMPRRPLSAAEAAAIHQFRGEFELRSLSSRGTRLWRSEGGTEWTVVVDPDMALKPCPLNRTAVLHPFRRLEEVAAAVAGWKGRLISCGWALGPHQERTLPELLAGLGLSRFHPLGQAQIPGGSEILFHDGVNPLEVLSGGGNRGPYLSLGYGRGEE